VICVPSGDHAGAFAVPQGETDFAAALPAAPQPSATGMASAEPSTADKRPSRIIAR
jgi:hypothetical protein